MRKKNYLDVFWQINVAHKRTKNVVCEYMLQTISTRPKLTNVRTAPALSMCTHSYSCCAEMQLPWGT